MVAAGFYGCSTATKTTENYGPEPAQPMGPMPPVTPLKEGEEYGPTAQKNNQPGVTLVLGSMPKTPAILIGAIRQIESEGILIKKIIALETASVMAGIHVASESASKADWNLTQIYKELEQPEKTFVGHLLVKDKKELQKKLERIFQSKNKGRISAEFIVASKESGSWTLFSQPGFGDKILPALKGCGWVDEAEGGCIKPNTKENYLELVKDETVSPVVFIEREVSTEKTDNKYFIQFPESANELIDPTSRSKHLFLGKKYIKQEAEKIKAWLKELKDKNESS